MSWNSVYALRSYARSSLWMVPLGAYLASVVGIRFLSWLDDRLGWSWDWVLDVPTAQTGLHGVTTATLSFIVFTFSSLLVAIQVASAQLTPRIIATTLLRDNTIRLIVALFVLTLAFNLGAMARTQDHVPYLLLTISFVLGGLSLAAFLYLIDYAARLLRPVSIVWRIGEQGLTVIEGVYPGKIKGTHAPSPPRPAMGKPDRIIVHRGKSGIVLAVDLDTLRREADRTDGVVEFVHQVGDFITVDEPLFLLYGKATSIEDSALRAAVAVGAERTIEQDATFAFRVIVDIAVKALSQAINDPTTAVLAIDQLHRLLRAVGRRHLHDDVLRDSQGRPRAIFRTPNWNDFVQLACREIRLYGAANFQVARRLRAMIENLLRVLPDTRHAALREELVLLDQTLDRLNLLPPDLVVARTPDLQGLGGASR
ncbi:MAG: DUF2254 domain-containing protein [Proteobacteria bacterium]|nr:DUF2254 domain-containing protein [Pseudomonadota bacterium]